MQHRWTSHLKDQEQKDQFKKSVLSSQFVLSRLQDIIKEDLEASQRSSLDDYDSPSWAYRQADKTGYQRALRIILTYLENK